MPLKEIAAIGADINRKGHSRNGYCTLHLHVKPRRIKDSKGRHAFQRETRFATSVVRPSRVRVHYYVRPRNAADGRKAGGAWTITKKL